MLQSILELSMGIEQVQPTGLQVYILNTKYVSTGDSVG